MCKFYLSVTTRGIVRTDPSLRYTNLFAGTLSSQQTTKSFFRVQDAIAKDSFYPYDLSLSCGDVDEAMARAHEVVEGEVHVEAQEHFYLEPQVTIAYPTEDGGMQVYCATQSLTFIQVRNGSRGLP